MTSEILEQVGALLAAASRRADAGVKAVYLAEARCRLAVVLGQAQRLDVLATAAEGELARVASKETAK